MEAPIKVGFNGKKLSVPVFISVFPEATIVLVAPQNSAKPAPSFGQAALLKPFRLLASPFRVFRGSLPLAACDPGQGTRGETMEYRECPKGSAATTTTIRATHSCHPNPSWTAAESAASRRFRTTHDLRQP